MRNCANITKSLYQIRQHSKYSKSCSFLASIHSQHLSSSATSASSSWSNNAISTNYYSALAKPHKNVVRFTTTSTTLPKNHPQIRFKSSSAAATAATNNPNVIPFLLADIGEGIAEVEIIQWFISPGASISQFDKVCEVQSDKATVEITSRYDGTVVSLEGKVGDMIEVGSPLIYVDVLNGDGGTAAAAGSGEESMGGMEIEENSTDVGSNAALEDGTSTLQDINDESNQLSAPDETPVTSPTDMEHLNNKKVLTTPAVRKLAKEHNIDLSSLTGTGPKGRILKSDILNLITPSTTTSSDEIEEDMKQSIIQQDERHTTEEEDEVVPIRGYHRLMIKSMEASLSIPHMTYADEVNMTALKQFRYSLKQKQQSISYLPFMIKAASLSLKEYPILNSSLRKAINEEGKEDLALIYHKSHNIGVAMDSPRGLVVPVIRDCGNLSVLEISNELLRLQKLANEGTLSEKDIQNPTFTLSNIGSIGGTYMSPIVVPPTVAIGAMGKIQRLPRFISNDSDEVEAVDVMQISWGGDHRVIDGATMAKFSNLWKDYLEDPLSMLLYMK